MPKWSSNSILLALDEAIKSSNLGRLFELGGVMIGKARADEEWIEAVVIVTGYLRGSTTHVWEAVDLSKRGALTATEGSTMQLLALQAFLASVAVLPLASERVEAAYGLVAVAPCGSVLVTAGLEVMLEDVPRLESGGGAAT